MIVCHNPLCHHHIDIPGVPEDQYMVALPTTPTPKGEYGLTLVKRFPYYRGSNPYPIFYLCGSCHHAVEMTRR